MRRLVIGTALLAPVAALFPSLDHGVAAAGGVPSCHGVPATIVGTPNRDIIIGTPGPDVIAGLGGRDHIEGRRGDDILCGGPGMDEVCGGAGDDWVADRRGPSKIDGGPDNDVLVVHGTDTTISYERAPRGVVVNLRTGRARGYGHDTIVLSNDRAWVLTSKYDDTILGPARGGHFVTFGGQDRVVVTDGSTAAYPTSFVRTGPGDDVLIGGPGSDYLFAANGADKVIGRGGGDFIEGGPGPDILLGGQGDDGFTDEIANHGTQAILGGPEQNSLLFWVNKAVTTDMRAGTLSIPSEDVVVTVQGIRDLHSENYRITWTAYGTDEAETYYSTNRIIAYMFGGDDFVSSEEADDYVDGGDGSDEVEVDGGTDTCVNVETPTGCDVFQEARVQDRR